jgi:Ino eighty subunit 2
MDTINKLLKKQAPKTNARRKDLAGPSASDNVDGEPAKPEPIFVRWVSNKDGNQINIPEEMIDSPVGGGSAIDQIIKHWRTRWRTSMH